MVTASSIRGSRIVVALLFLLTLVVPLGVSARATQTSHAGVDPILLQQTSNGQQTSFWVVFRGKANLHTASTVRSWTARGSLVVQQLQDTATTAQAGVRAFLDSRQVKYRPFWIVNAIQVTGDRALLEALEAMPEVTKIIPDAHFSLPQPIDPKRGPQIQAVEWNIERIRAPEVWSTFDDRGEGIVVGSIDSGVQFDHPALVNQYRGNRGGGVFDHNYNWFDPLHGCFLPEPCDFVAHGTHTMGTMIGDDGDAGENEIGVAPGAKWIAAKGCDMDGCSLEGLVASGQWMLAPTNLDGSDPRPDMRPHIINNSWGGDFHDEFYQEIVNAWVASGIFPVFAVGNAGPRCQSTGSPGDYVNTYAVGAFDNTNAIAPFSSRGPAVFGDTNEIKPNISAPGVDVRSSVPGGTYEIFSGTSMAAPHLAGTVALMWSAAPALVGDIESTRALLDRTAVDVVDDTCESYPAPLLDGNVDNNVWGEGRLDAFAAVAASPRGPTGVLTGTVTDAGTNSPIAGAKIEITGTFTRTVTTDSAGGYTTHLPVGTFDLVASAFGYQAESATGITITEGVTRTQDFALTALPRHVVSGQVRDTTGAPLFGARVTVEDTPLASVTTATNGAYSFPAVPEGSYNVHVDAGGCNTPQTLALVVDGDETLDFTLARLEDGYGYFCHTEQASYIDATNVLSLTGDYANEAVALPFPFTFYGQTYSDTVSVGTDGLLDFQGLLGTLDNVEIPNPFVPNAAIYPFWDDLLIDQDASIRTELIGTAPNRGLVVEWRNATFYADTSKRVNFEAVLYENGDILTQYQGNLGSDLVQGGSATAGLEDENGTVALQYSYNKPLLVDGLAIRYQLPPSGFVEGLVIDANNGQPVGGATVRALNNGEARRLVTTNAQGMYRMQLPLGTYTLEATSANYSVESAQVTIDQEDETITQNFSLRGALAEVNPSSFEFVLTPGSQRSANLALHNAGTLDLTWELLEVAGPNSQQPQSPPALRRLNQRPAWRATPHVRQLPRALPKASPTAATDTIIDDPSGDAVGSVDITTVRSGSDGASATIAIDFSPTTPVDQVVGYVFLDTDQDTSTGVPPDSFFGLPTQDLGVDYFADLFGIHESEPFVAIVSTLTFEAVAIVPVTIDGQTISFDVPYAAVADDGVMNTAMVLGDFSQPTDWAPDVGHGTLVPFTDVSWLSASPTSGTLAPDATQNIAVTVDTTGLEPGVYNASLVVRSNSTQSPTLYVPVHLVVPAYQQAVNNGGGAYTDGNGDTWAADRAYTAGSWGYINASKTATTSSPIAGTADDALYQNARRGLVEYRFDGLTAGTYEVALDFAEIQGKARDKRIFDVIVEGALVLPAHDIAAEVGGLAADNHTFYVTVNDGQLSVRFVTRSGFGVPLINAMRITHRPDK
jgi:subtilisin family serine protease